MYRSDSNYLTKLFFARRQGNVKSLMKTLSLHIIMIEAFQYMFIHHKEISRMNAIAAKQCLCMGRRL